MLLALILVSAYVLGAIPTSYLVVRWLTGRDIRTMGTGNPGTMNVLDTVGWRPAAAVAIGDIGKGMAAVGLAYGVGLEDPHAVLAALAAIIGHDWPVFLRFRGGNGMGPAVGGLAALLPLAFAIGLGVAVAVLLAIRSRRVAGLAGLLVVPLVALQLDAPDAKVFGALSIILLPALKIATSEGFSLARPSR